MRGLMIASVSLLLISVTVAAPRKASSQHGSTSNTVGQRSNDASDSASECECVPYYQCDNGTISTNGGNGGILIDIRMSVSDPCATAGFMRICCKPPDIKLTPDRGTVGPKIPRGCGHRNPNGVEFSITGQTDNEAHFAEFPWMVMIFVNQVIGNNGETKMIYKCGGALIHTQAVLTAAHCVNSLKGQPSEIKIRVGEWDTETTDEPIRYQERRVKSVIVHENFNSGSLWNDVAILILKAPVKLANNVEIVCLPQANAVFDGSRCFASGWGKDTFGKEGLYQNILKKIDLPVVPHGNCQTALRTTRLGNYFNLDQSFMCAGGEPGKDTCRGDGGSPLVCPLSSDPTRYVQAGIVAWGIGCGSNQIPGVYTNVAALREWIDEQMGYNNLDITVYQP